MPDYQQWLAFGVFVFTIILLMWRPGRMNESIPTSLGALILVLAGVVSYRHILEVFGIVSGAAVTILSTIVMSIILESIGFFRWVAFNLVERARGSGVKLFWLILLLCFLMTLFFNNDGSILITTPIIIQIGNILELKPKQKIPYLLSGALIATVSSAPIGVSNLANLIALRIVGLDLNQYTAMMFVPSMIGILCISALLYLYFQRDIPREISKTPIRYSLQSGRHPLLYNHKIDSQVDWWLFRACIGIVVFIRAGFFLAEDIGIPIELVALIGVVLMIVVRWYRTKKGLRDVVTKTPWHILLFAFSIYIIVNSLHRAGMTEWLITLLQPFADKSEAGLIAASGLMLTLLSNLVNNLPSVMIGTFAVTDMGLEQQSLQLAYLANIIGSDIGAVLTPVGTLATLLWMYILKNHHIPITWKQYMKVTLIVIPIGLIVSLMSLFVWTQFLL
ncbi:arsenic transporter [Paenibacillus sp. YPG26]|uniref:arsenic transporter n=1 Tax=Paenibacillus sp. YPG26 TaxID=2878915 RepID=UPI00203FEB62|nr:arsenic transporter [Paenibacillus sp. YPG26]USB32148.1 arsenic transporter [Paenibacillus sp. YPG26]